MESIGQILKTAREQRQISISDVSVSTKMTSTFVKAIEADNFNALVAPVYARGFIKLYAECVGLDPMPLLKQFDVSGRAAPTLASPPPKASPMKASAAYAEKLQPPRLQQSGPLSRHGATGKPEQKKADGRSIAGRKVVSGAALPTTAPLLVDMRMPISSLPSSWLASLAGRLSALNRMFTRVQWPQFELPGIVWRRIFIVAGVVLLVIAASQAWEWSRRGLPFTADACRWLAEPPAPYLTVEAHVPAPGR